MKTLTINVTEADIKGGTPDSFTNCPIGRCLKRNGYEAKVYHGAIIANGLIYRTNELIRSFIEDFDGDRKVSPFETELCVSKDLVI